MVGVLGVELRRSPSGEGSGDVYPEMGEVGEAGAVLGEPLEE